MPLTARKERVQMTTIFLLLFCAAVLVRIGITTEVSYRPVRISTVEQVPGADFSERLVTVDLGDRQRAIRTSDRLLYLEADQIACLKESQALGRRWTRYALALPGYCRL